MGDYRFQFRSRNDRVLIAVASGFFLFLIVCCILTVGLVFKANQPDRMDRLTDQLFDALMHELLLGTALFCAVMFIHALFLPKWTEHLLRYSAQHAWQAICIFSLGAVGFAVVSSVV